MAVDVRTLIEHNAEELGVAWLAGAEGASRAVVPHTGAEPADLIGHLNLIHPNRVHVLGEPELLYFSRQDTERQQAILTDLVAGHPPAVIIAESLEAPAAMMEMAQREALPLLSSRLTAARVIDSLRNYLAKAAAESCQMHGVLMDVLGMGVLISGESGLGKSELALELISRGHGLVADDVVDFSRIAPHIVEGRCPPLLRNLLEVRGLGLLDIRAIFGETAVRPKMKLKLIVHLIRRSAMENDFERLPLEALTQSVLGVPIRKVVIPVAAGRNLAVLTEAAVRSTVLQLRGFDTMGDFIARQRQMIESEGWPPEPGR
jgi:HPr kinase/phosphorylase